MQQKGGGVEFYVKNDYKWMEIHCPRNETLAENVWVNIDLFVFQIDIAAHLTKQVILRGIQWS